MRESRAQHTTSRWTIRRARTLAYVALFVGSSWAAACGSDGGTSPVTPPAATPLGNYTITTANGNVLPVALAADGNYKWEVTAGTIALTADGKYSSTMTFRQTIPGNIEMFMDSTGGTWVQSGAAITLTNPQDGSTGTMTWAGSQLTFPDVDGKVTTTYVYTKK